MCREYQRCFQLSLHERVYNYIALNLSVTDCHLGYGFIKGSCKLKASSATRTWRAVSIQTRYGRCLWKRKLILLYLFAKTCFSNILVRCQAEILAKNFISILYATSFLRFLNNSKSFVSSSNDSSTSK